MASGQWQALAEQFQVICPPGAGSPGDRRGKASCGHWGVTSFCCPRCPGAPWLWQELCRHGLFSDKDRTTLEAQILAQEGARGSYRQCPRCQRLVQRLDPGTLRTPCLPCSQEAGGELYCFCWGCLTDWRGSSPHTDLRCPLQAALHDAPKIQAPRSSVHGCPSLRACPACRVLLSHTGKGFPQVGCPECRFRFCYRCLGPCKGRLCAYPIADRQLVCEGDAVTLTPRGSPAVAGGMG
ncbi:uncharacterized protein [Emydura macquarii macquarii]|uniref:uncharacterized protein isoform X2 n=1 Tax=Emydura macquarii macquarii TaxID=1129001 RepID=UPI00352BAB81